MVKFSQWRGENNQIREKIISDNVKSVKSEWSDMFRWLEEAQGADNAPI